MQSGGSREGCVSVYGRRTQPLGNCARPRHCPLYRLALEKQEAGARYHASAEEGVPVRDIAEAIGRGLKVPVVSKSPEEAAAQFGWLGMFRWSRPYRFERANPATTGMAPNRARTHCGS